VSRPPVFWLSFHAAYACRDSGVCCSSGWDIALETGRVTAIEGAVKEQRIVAPAGWLRHADGAPDDIAGVLAHSVSGACVFHRAPGCAIHGTIGHHALPSACQHFPRIVLMDRRGVFVTLSHYCPTARALLFEDTGTAAIVEGPPVIPDDGAPEGLDARDTLPPCESPQRLMDWVGYSQWEHDLVRALTSTSPVDQVIDERDPVSRRFDQRTLFEFARAALPPPFTWPEYVPAAAPQSPVVGRFLAAHAFASWMAYQGNGLAATLLYLRVVLAVLSVESERHQGLQEGVREADLLLRHLVDRESLAGQLSRVSARKLLKET
jgi:hypothetical protein